MEFMPRLLTEDREFSAFQFVKISSDEWMIIFLKTLQEIRLELMGMMLKQNARHSYGRPLIPHTPEKHKCTREWKQCWSICSIIALVFIVSLFQQARQLIRLIIWKLWGICGMEYEENYWKCWLQECVTSIMTVH
jgi:hypothetical protein